MHSAKFGMLLLTLDVLSITIVQIELSEGIFRGRILKLSYSNPKLNNLYRFYQRDASSQPNGIRIIKYTVKDYIHDFSQSKQVFTDSQHPRGRIIDPFTFKQIIEWVDEGGDLWSTDDFRLISISTELQFGLQERGRNNTRCEPTSDFRTYVGRTKEDPNDPLEVANRRSVFIKRGESFVRIGAQPNPSAVGCDYKQTLTCQPNSLNKANFCTNPTTRTLNEKDNRRGLPSPCKTHHRVLPHYVDMKALLIEAITTGRTAPRSAKPVLVVMPFFNESVENQFPTGFTYCPSDKPYCSFGNPAQTNRLPYFFSNSSARFGCLVPDLNLPTFLRTDTEDYQADIGPRIKLPFGSSCNWSTEALLFTPKDALSQLEVIYELTDGDLFVHEFCNYTQLLHCKLSSTRPGALGRCECLEDAILYKGATDPAALGNQGCQRTLPYLATCDGTALIPYPVKNDTVEFPITTTLNVMRTGLSRTNISTILTLQCMPHMTCDTRSGENKCKCNFKKNPSTGASTPVAGADCLEKKAELIQYNSNRYIPQVNGTQLPESNHTARLLPYVRLNHLFLELEVKMVIPAHQDCREEKDVDEALIRIRTFYLSFATGELELELYEEVERDFLTIRGYPNVQLCQISYQKNQGRTDVHPDPILVCRFGICRRVDGYDDLDELMLAFEAEMRTLYRRGTTDRTGTELRSRPCDVAVSPRSNRSTRRQAEVDAYVNKYINFDKNSPASNAARKNFSLEFDKVFMALLRREGRRFCRTELGLSCVTDSPGEEPYCGCSPIEYIPWDRNKSVTIGGRLQEKENRSCAIQFSHPCDLCIPSEPARPGSSLIFDIKYPCSKMPTDDTVLFGRGFTIGADYCVEGSQCLPETFGELPTRNNPVPDAKYCRKASNGTRRTEQLIDPRSKAVKTKGSTVLLVYTILLNLLSRNGNGFAEKINETSIY